MKAPAVHSEIRPAGHVRLILDAPPGNIVSIALVSHLHKAIDAVAQQCGVRLLTIEGAGDHFSYGASVDEHRAEQIGAALGALHDLVRALLSLRVPTGAIVRGRCLGGGFELALACDFVFAAENAILGVPEIALGVFPPAASALLPERVGAARATSAILTGQPRPADDWNTLGLFEVIAPSAALDTAIDAWFDKQLASKSAAALGCAAFASRSGIRHRVDAVLPELEHFYLDTLMRTHDAVEGIEAFLTKRAPVWTHA